MAAPRPSASVILLSPANSILMLHRGSTSPSFPSAHVFPGGNLDAFHEGPLPGSDSDPAAPTPKDSATLLDELHSDGPAFRLAAARECFEECGVLLAKRKDGARDEKGDICEMVSLDEAAREEGRRMVRDKEVKFTDWVESIGGFVDTENLIPFTRWITPITSPQRFTTQMYLYFLPLSSSAPDSDEISSTTTVPAADGDGGREVTSATFAPANTWLRRADANQITLYPPQYYLLNTIAQFTSAPLIPASASTLAPPGMSTAPHTSSPLNPASHAPPPSPSELASQRTALLTHVHYPSPPPASPHPPTSPLSPAMLNPRGTALTRIPPGKRVICPRTLFVRGRDGFVVLGLDQPGPELQGTRYSDLEDEDAGKGSAGLERGGDGDKVVLVAFAKGGVIKKVEVRSREDVLREEKEGKATDAAAAVGMTAIGGGRKL